MTLCDWIVKIALKHQANSGIRGVEVGNMEHKLFFYADDTLAEVPDLLTFQSHLMGYCTVTLEMIRVPFSFF